MEPLSKRQFLKFALSFTGLAGASSALAFEPEAIQTPRWDTLETEQLQDYLGSHFLLNNESQYCELVLDDVVAKVDPSRPDFLPRKQGFTASFKPNQTLEGFDFSQVNRVFHPELGEAAVLLSCLPYRDSDRHYLEVVFN